MLAGIMTDKDVPRSARVSVGQEMPQEPPLQASISRMKEAVEQNHNLMSRIKDKLMPVLQPSVVVESDYKASDDSHDKLPSLNVVREMDVLHAQLRDVIEIQQEILDRIQM